MRHRIRQLQQAGLAAEFQQSERVGIHIHPEVPEPDTADPPRLE